MAYSTSNPPRLSVYPGLTAGPPSVGHGGQVWSYLSTDALAVVIATNYMTNAADLGMMTGDVVLVCEYDAPAIAWARVLTVTATGTIMSAGLAIT